MTDKKLQDMTFEQLVDHATSQAHSALLERGGKGLRQMMRLWMHQAIVWDNLKKIKEDS